MTDQLSTLMGNYFHDAFGSLDATIREYLDDSVEQDLRALMGDIDRFLVTTPTVDVPTALHALGSRVHLGDEPSSYVRWLEAIRQATGLRLERISRPSPAEDDGRSDLEVLLDDIDEELTTVGTMLVGYFFWFLRGGRRELTYPEMQALSEQAYAIVRRRYRTRLVWSTWPTDFATARPADESAPLDFDLDPDEPVDTPMLVLVLED